MYINDEDEGDNEGEDEDEGEEENADEDASNIVHPKEEQFLITRMPNTHHPVRVNIRTEQTRRTQEPKVTNQRRINHIRTLIHSNLVCEWRNVSPVQHRRYRHAR